MATDWTYETRSNEEKITILQAANSDTKDSLADQNVASLGTNRRSEIIAKIGDTGQNYSKIYNDYLDSL